LLSGKSIREPGASYRCHLSGEKHTCIEKDIEIIPLRKIITVLPEDTFGISKILTDYRVETTFQMLDHRSTKVEISHYYSTTTLKAKLLNLIAKGKIARDTQATLNAAKTTIEYYNYHAVPGNLTSLLLFRARLSRIWRHQLRQRGDQRKIAWAKFAR